METGGNNNCSSTTDENGSDEESGACGGDTDGRPELTSIDSRSVSSEQHLQSLQRFHQRCGRRITLANGNRTATRSIRDFSHALVFSAEPLIDDVLFEVVIEKKNHSWGGSIEIGVTAENPDRIDIPSCATVLRNGAWVMSGIDVRKDSVCIVEFYGTDLESLNESDRVGVMRTSDADLVFYINGQSQGVAARNLPKPVWALVDLYGRCVQVSICPTDACPSSEYTDTAMSIPQQINAVLANLSLGSSSSTSPTSSNGLMGATPSNNSVHMTSGSKTNVNPFAAITAYSSASNSSSSTNASTVPLPLTDYYDMNGRLRFHTRCGSLVKLSPNCRSAERRRPLDEFNNGVVMTHRPIKDNELFEIRIDKLVNKWSGSIEVGVTTHNPSTLLFPATMTNMRSGTIMMSGCGILINGKGTNRRFGEFNLDELREGDRVGLMRKSNGNLHYYFNGQDQGVSATRVAATLWGVIDLYGMTIKVTIVDRDERETQNLVTRRNNLTSAPMLISGMLPALSLPSPEPDLTASLPSTSAPPLMSAVSTDDLTSDENADEHDLNNRNSDRLTFHPICGTYAMVSRNGRKAYRPNAADDFNNGVVITRRPLRPNELFQVRLDRIVTKWAGSVEMGVTTFSAEELDFPFTMTNVRTGTWMMTGNGVMHNGITVIEQYGQNLDRLQWGDRVGVVRKDDGTLHFWVNGVDQGPAAHNVPEKVYGVIDLYGQAAQVTIVDSSECGTPDTGGNSTISNTTLYTEPPLRFHSLVHGKNAGISNGGLTATRPNSLAEFNDAIVFSSRPLRQRELFEVQLETVVRHWSGNVEIGVVSTRPEELQLAANATDLKAPDTIILCGSIIFHNRKALGANVDIDLLGVRARVGVMRIGDAIHFFIDGVDHGPSVECRAPNVWAVVDLYGQCAQVSLTQQQPDMRAPYATSENSQSCQATSVIQPTSLEAKHRWTCISGNVQLTQNWTIAARGSGNQAALSHGTIFSEPPLSVGAPFEIKILSHNSMFAGSLSIGVTDLNLADHYVRKNIPIGIKRIPANVWYLTGNTVCYNSKVLQRCMVSLDWLREGDRIALELTAARTLRVLINSEDMHVHFQNIPSEVYVVLELEGATMAVQVMSTQGPSSPLRPCSLRLQDSLDFGVDSLNKQDSMLESIETENFEFGDNLHGKHISLLENHKIAMRTQSFNQALVFVTKPLCRGDSISIKIESINEAWKGTIGVGVVGYCPQSFLSNNSAPIPSCIMQCRRPCWAATDDFININGQHIESQYGKALKHIECGTIITMSLSHNGLLSIIIIGESTNNLEELGTNLPNHVYPVFDLYGKCEKISLLSQDEVLQQNGTPIIEEVPLEMDKACLNVSASVKHVESVINEVVEEVVKAAERRAEIDESIEKIELPTSTVTTLNNHEQLANDLNNEYEEAGVAYDWHQNYVRVTLANAANTTTTASTATTRPQTPVAPRPSQRLVDYDARYGRAEKATFDLPEKDVTELSNFRTSNNSLIEINRSLMESLEENLLKNLTIQMRTSEQNHVGDSLCAGSSTSSVCCLQESLQLQHNTNLNIQRSQSTQRFTNSFNALVSAASGITISSPTTTATATNNFNYHNNNNNNSNNNNNNASLNITNTTITTTTTIECTTTTTTVVVTTTSSENLVESTVSSPLATTMCSVAMSNANPTTAISSIMSGTNPTQALLRTPIASTVAGNTGNRAFLDSNRQEYEREQRVLPMITGQNVCNYVDLEALLQNNATNMTLCMAASVEGYSDSDSDEDESYAVEIRPIGTSEGDFIYNAAANANEEGTRIRRNNRHVELFPAGFCRRNLQNAILTINDEDNDNEDDYEEHGEEEEEQTVAGEQTEEEEDEDEREYVDDDQEKDFVERLHETDDSDDDDEDEDTAESNLSVNAINRHPSHHTNDDDDDNDDDNGKLPENEQQNNANAVESHDLPAHETEEQTRTRQQENQNNAATLNDEIDDDDDLDVETALEVHTDALSFVSHVRRLYGHLDAEDDEVDRHIALARYQRCGHLYSCNCLAEKSQTQQLEHENSTEHANSVGNRNEFMLNVMSLWHESDSRAGTQLENADGAEKNALDEIETESKQSSLEDSNSAPQRHIFVLPEEFEEAHILDLLNNVQNIIIDEDDDIEKPLRTQESLEASPSWDYAYAPKTCAKDVDADIAEVASSSTSNACALELPELPSTPAAEAQLEEWTTEEEEETQAEVVAEPAVQTTYLRTVEWQRLKLPLNVPVERYAAVCRNLLSQQTTNCDYYQLMLNFVQTLVLPRIYMDTQTPAVCFCPNCYGRDTQRLSGWAYFKLNTSVVNKRAENSVSQLESCTGEWLPLYYITSVDNVRRILDLGRLLPHDVYKRREHLPFDPDLGCKEEPSRRVELHVSPNARTVQICAHKPKMLSFGANKYNLYTAFEVYVRRQALRRIQQTSTDLDDAQQSDIAATTLASDLERVQQDLTALLAEICEIDEDSENQEQQESETHNAEEQSISMDINDLRRTLATYLQDSNEQIEAQPAWVCLPQGSSDRQKTTSITPSNNLLMDSDDEINISAESDSEQSSVCSTRNIQTHQRALNAAAIAVAAVQGPSLKEQIWFTKEAGACIITGLMFKLELRRHSDSNQHIKSAVIQHMSEAKTTASPAAFNLSNFNRLRSRSARFSRFSHFGTFWNRNRRSCRQTQPDENQIRSRSRSCSRPRQRMHRTSKHNKRNTAKPTIPVEE